MTRIVPVQPKSAARSSHSQVGRSKVDKTRGSSVIDDEARESDGDGVLVDEADMDADSESEGYEKEFIDDGEHEEGVNFGTPDLTPAPEVTQTRKTPAKTFVRPKKLVATPVIELESSDEDLEVMDVDDSMYRKPAGVKATALPPALVTRSKRVAEGIKLREEEPNKKMKGENSVSKESQEQRTGSGSFDEAAMERFMAAFMDKYMRSNVGAHVFDGSNSVREPVSSNNSQRPSSTLRRVDFDQIELEKGLAASRTETKSVASRKPKSTPARKSPVWDIESDAESEVSSPVKGKGKGKATTKGRADVEVAEVALQSAVKDEASNSSAAASGAQRDVFVPEKKRSTALEKAFTTGPGDDKVTIAQFFKENSTVGPVDDAAEVDAPSSEDTEPPSTVFLEDLETYKSFYDPDVPCGVFDPDLQDPALAPTYRKLPPLPSGRRLLAVYDPSRNNGDGAEDDVKGGRAKFSSWRRHLKSMLAKNCIGAMLFVEASPVFINLSRVSPLRLSKQASPGASAAQRLLVDGKIAVCVSPIFCTESMVVTPGKIGPKTERTRKWIAGIFHNQDWERFESIVCLVFGEDLMYTNINNKKAVSFLTMLSPADATVGSKDSDLQFSKMAPADMFSPVVSTTPSKSRSGPSKTSPSKPRTLLAHNDFLPVFDARKTVIDFDTDLGRLSTVLPAFTGEIPFSSFVVVGYSVSSYMASISGSAERVPHVSCNVLWAIVCGTPVLGRK